MSAPLAAATDGCAPKSPLLGASKLAMRDRPAMPDCVRGGHGHFAVSNLAEAIRAGSPMASGARSPGDPPA
jgi:hypothetical protein